jgi:putative two-component system response regulator
MPPYKIMVVDDEPANLRLLKRLFRRDYQLITAASGAEALRLLEQHDVALLITDQRMPGMTGIELLVQAAAFRPHMVRMILTGYTDISTLVEAINCGQIYKYVTKPWQNGELRLTVERALEHYQTNRARHELEWANERLTARLKEMSQGFVRAIGDALEAKDGYVHGHARRVSGYATAIGRRMRLDVAVLEQISVAAFLHDVGKIGTPDHILLKPAPLTDEEHAVMQLHAERGSRMFAGFPDMQEIARAVRHHHEHYDGSGYPGGLCGENIPIAARIIHVADAYDAMTSPRSFRQAYDHETAIRELENKAASQFDPQVVRAFCGLEAIARIRESIAAGISGICLSPASILFDTVRDDSDDLASAVEAEPLLAAAILRKANAIFGAEATVKLNVACARLGKRNIRACVVRNGVLSTGPYGPEQLWEHSLRCATTARLLAEQTLIMDADEAYTLGLLHDIGKILLLGLFPAEMENILWLNEETSSDREVAAFGVDHAQVGQWVLESCGVPRALTAAVQTHHDGMRINSPMALLLHVANAIARADEPHKAVTLDALGAARLALLGLSRADLASIRTRTAAALEFQLPASSEAAY